MGKYDDVLAIGSRGITGDKFMEISTNVIYSHYPLHNHDLFEMAYVLKGRGTTNINGKKYNFAEKTFFLCTNTDFHEIFPESECSILDIHIRTDWIDPEILNKLTTAVLIPNYDNTVIDRINNEFFTQYAKSNMYLKHLTNSILIDCIHALDNDKNMDVYMKFSTPIGKALQIIHSSFNENLSLEDVAEKVQLSPNYFSSKFHNEVKSTFQEYLLGLRLEAAKKYLIATPCSVTDLCFFSGFNNYINFSKAFKKKFGVSPTQFRNALK